MHVPLLMLNIVSLHFEKLASCDGNWCNHDITSIRNICIYLCTWEADICTRSQSILNPATKLTFGHHENNSPPLNGVTFTIQGVIPRILKRNIYRTDLRIWTIVIVWDLLMVKMFYIWLDVFQRHKSVIITICPEKRAFWQWPAPLQDYLGCSSWKSSKLNVFPKSPNGSLEL